MKFLLLYAADMKLFLPVRMVFRTDWTIASGRVVWGERVGFGFRFSTCWEVSLTLINDLGVIMDGKTSNDTMIKTFYVSVVCSKLEYESCSAFLWRSTSIKLSLPKEISLDMRCRNWVGQMRVDVCFSVRDLPIVENKKTITRPYSRKDKGLIKSHQSESKHFKTNYTMK
jgi:hypothetical protein